MIFGKLAVFFNLLSIVALSALFLISVVSVVAKIKLFKSAHYSAASRRRALWLVVLSPWIVGLFAATLALVSSSQYFALPDIFNLLHWHHPQEFLFYSWHGISLLFVVLYMSLLIIRSAKRLHENSRQVNLLYVMANPDKDGFYQLDTDEITAFTAGFSHPKCYITSALRNQLDEGEYTIVQLHEKEHARRYDPLNKWLFQLFSSIFPFGVSRLLNQLMLVAMEQGADSAILKRIKDKSKIAETLLKVRRLTLMPSEVAIDEHAVCYYAHDHIQARICYLLSDHKQKIFPLFPLVLATFSMSIICALSVDTFHHLIEYTLSH